jgi:hypothetical protein
MLTLSLLYSPLHRLLSSHFQVSTVRKPGSTGKVVVNVNLPNDPYVTAGLAENNCVVRLDLSAEHDNIVIPCKVVVSFNSNNKLEVGDPIPYLQPSAHQQVDIYCSLMGSFPLVTQNMHNSLDSYAKVRFPLPLLPLFFPLDDD